MPCKINGAGRQKGVKLITTINIEMFVDIKNMFASNNIRRKASFSGGLTPKSGIFVNCLIDR